MGMGSQKGDHIVILTILPRLAQTEHTKHR